MQPAAYSTHSAARPASEGKVGRLEVLRAKAALTARERMQSRGASWRQVLRGICGWACAEGQGVGSRGAQVRMSLRSGMHARQHDACPPTCVLENL
jgi:hypothetical protein